MPQSIRLAYQQRLIFLLRRATFEYFQTSEELALLILVKIPPTFIDGSLQRRVWAWILRALGMVNALLEKVCVVNRLFPSLPTTVDCWASLIFWFFSHEISDCREIFNKAYVSYFKRLSYFFNDAKKKLKILIHVLNDN